MDGYAPPRAIHLRRQSLEFKSRHALEKLTKYSSMVGHSPIPRFDSTFCGETIVSKTAQESGYLFELSGTAVGALSSIGPGKTPPATTESIGQRLF
jgi:hypothetical protein